MDEDKLRELRAMSPEAIEAKYMWVQKLFGLVFPLIFLGFAFVVFNDFGIFKWIILAPLSFFMLRAGIASLKAKPVSSVGGVEKKSGIPGYTPGGNISMARQELDPARTGDSAKGVVLRKQSRVSAILVIGTVFCAGLYGFIFVAATGKIVGPAVVLAVIGLALLIPCGYYWLRAFGPSMELAVDSSVVVLGSPLKVRWSKKGLGSVTNLRIALIGTESTTYTRGTTSYTDREKLAEFEVLNTSNPTKISDGKSSIDIPSVLMHSFGEESNKIYWELHVEGVVPFWPDMKDYYPVTLVPPEVSNA